MEHRPVVIPARTRSDRIRDAALAIVVALLLSACWGINDWAQVGRLNLPDNDDMMRLAQVRDLLAGQAWNDWAQYRLGPLGGAPMHWSRIGDIGPAVLMWAFGPLAMILAYPALLFAGYLYLSARLGRAVAGPQAALVAVILAAIAYPANSLFLPGRIDHHGLQIVLIMGAALALIRSPDARGGAIVGIASAISFGIGLETAPHVAAIMAVVFARWVWRGERGLPAGFAIGLCATTVLLLAAARPSYWSSQWCDSFTPASSSAALAAAALFGAFSAASGFAWRKRLALGMVLGAVTLSAVLASYPVCVTGPYGPMDPLVRHAFIDNVLEAQGVFSGRLLGIGMPSGGLMLVASLVAVWFAWRRPARAVAVAPLIALLAISDLVILAQVRGAYIGSAVTAPLLAALVLAARNAGRWRVPALVAAWSVSAGMLWLIVPGRIEAALQPAAPAGFAATAGCRAGDVWQQLDRAAPGTVMAPMGMAGYVIGGTHHRSVGAGYHRNNVGNRALYDFFLAPPDRAHAIAARWRVDYVAICPTDFAELDIGTAHRDSLAAGLVVDRAPAWLTRIPLRDTGLRFYRLNR